MQLGKPGFNTGNAIYEGCDRLCIIKSRFCGWKDMTRSTAARTKQGDTCIDKLAHHVVWAVTIHYSVTPYSVFVWLTSRLG